MGGRASGIGLLMEVLYEYSRVDPVLLKYSHFQLACETSFIGNCRLSFGHWPAFSSRQAALKYTFPIRPKRPFRHWRFAFRSTWLKFTFLGLYSSRRVPH